MDRILEQLVTPLAAIIQVGASLIIMVAFFQAMYQISRFLFRPKYSNSDRETIRIQLGTWLSLALEFELAADILKSAIAPTWDAIGKLAAIIVLRTLLNYFLQRDIERAQVR